MYQGRLPKRWRRRFPEGDIVITLENMNVKLGSDDTMLGHMVGEHDLDDRNDNDQRFVDFSTT